MIFDAVLFDRDGTLIEDVPYNADPEKVRPVAGARAALDRLRAAGLRVGVVTNQSGLARGLFGPDDLARVDARVTELLGPFDTWQICPHDDGAGCGCRKPAPGLVTAAADALRTHPRRCVVIGDVGGDMRAALAAGATGVLVPTPITRPEEVAEAPVVAGTVADAVDLVLRRGRLFAGDVATRPAVPAGADRPAGHVLVARCDSAGDLLLTGPAIRAVARGARSVTLLCGPRGRAAADLLPGVDRVLEHGLPWIDPRPRPVDAAAVDRLRADLAAAAVDEAIVFTSFHQSPLPLALLLRLAGVRRVSAISDDYPGSLLDVRHRVPTGVPEVERALSLAVVAGFPPDPRDEPVLRVRHDPPPRETGYVVVHPGASVPARACPPRRVAGIVAALIAAGSEVVVTGAPQERELTRRVAAPGARDLGGRTTLAELAGVLAGAACVVVGNTGPAHLAAAVGTPVVSLFAPTVDFGQWAPYRVPLVRLGTAGAPCRGTRVTECPFPGHPCLSDIDPGAVVAAVTTLTSGGAR
jgi:histidinol-phosphate phosphatase family protein